MTDTQAGVQKCRKCGKCKPEGDFLKRRNGGLIIKAKSCLECRQAALAYYHKHYAPDPSRREEARKKANAYYHANREQCLKVSTEYQKNNPGRHRKSSWVCKLKCAYGLTNEQYEDMLSRQDGCCAVCKRPPLGRKLSVDHCHSTKKIRGLLCHSCNIALGMLKDDPQIALSASEYLKQGGENEESNG